MLFNYTVYLTSCLNKLFAYLAVAGLLIYKLLCLVLMTVIITIAKYACKLLLTVKIIC